MSLCFLNKVNQRRLKLKTILIKAFVFLKVIRKLISRRPSLTLAWKLTKHMKWSNVLISLFFLFTKTISQFPCSMFIYEKKNVHLHVYTFLNEKYRFVKAMNNCYRSHVEKFLKKTTRFFSSHTQRVNYFQQRILNFPLENGRVFRDCLFHLSSTFTNQYYLKNH